MPSDAINTIRSVVIDGAHLSIGISEICDIALSLSYGIVCRISPRCLPDAHISSTTQRLSACMVLIALRACRLSEAVYAAAIIILVYSIGRIMLSIKAISSLSKLYF